MAEEAGVSKKVLVSSSMRSNYEYVVRAKVGRTEIYNKNIFLYTTIKHFLVNRYPIRFIVCMLTAQAYYDIVSKCTPDKPYVQVKLDVLCKYDNDAENIHVHQYVLNGEYLGIVDKTYVDKRILTEGDELDNVYKLRIGLFDEKDLHIANKGTVSGFFDNINIDNMIKHAFGRCKSNNLSRVVIAKPDNVNMMKSIAIQPSGFFQFLDYVDKEYGIYEGGYNAFVENNVCYILDKHKSDAGLGNTYAGSEDDEITIQVISSSHPNNNMTGVYKKDGHLVYIIYDNNLVTTETTNDNIMQPHELCINSDYGSVSKNHKKYEGITDSIVVSKARQRQIPSSKKNPKFKANIKIVGLPVDIKPYTIVRFVSGRMSGDCIVSKFTTYLSSGKFVNELDIVSYDEFFKYEVEESKKYDNI